VRDQPLRASPGHPSLQLLIHEYAAHSALFDTPDPSDFPTLIDRQLIEVNFASKFIPEKLIKSNGG
jgi:hypothetical protein